MNSSRKLYSCNCLFDICCISKFKNETFKEIGVRVSEYCSKIYQKMIKKGMCRCSNRIILFFLTVNLACSSVTLFFFIVFDFRKRSYSFSKRF